MSLSGMPFDDIRELIDQLPELDEEAIQQTNIRNQSLSEKFGDLGKQKEIAIWLAGASGKSPNIVRPMVALLAGTHRIGEQIADTNEETTLQSVTRLAAGGAPVNQVCADNNIGLKVFDLALQFPVNDISMGEALDEKSCAATIGFGMEAIAGGVDLLCLAGFGQASQIANRVIMGLLFGEVPEQFPDKCDDNFKLHAQLVRQSIEFHQGKKHNPLEILRCVGGREHAALAGAILAARINHVPVILDGLSAISVAALLGSITSDVLSHCIIACDPSNYGFLNKQFIDRPYVFDGYGVLGQGCIGAQAIGVVKSTANIHANSVIDGG